MLQLHSPKKDVASARLPHGEPRSNGTRRAGFLLGFKPWARRRVAILLVGMAAAAPGGALGQPLDFEPSENGFFLFPSLGAYAVLEDNLFFRAADVQGAGYGRLSPSLAASYRQGRLRLGGEYSIDSELFPVQQEQLTDPLSRQQVRLDFFFRPNRNTSLSLEAGYLSTNRPSELIEDSGLEIGRDPSSGIGGEARFTTRLTRRQELLVGVEHNVNELRREGEGTAFRNAASVAFLGWRREWSPRRELQVEYRYRAFATRFGAGSESSSGSHALLFGVSWKLNRRTDLVLQLGPRYSGFAGTRSAADGAPLPEDDALSPEASASILHQWRKSSLSLGYRQSQNQSIGITQFVETKSVSLELSAQPRRSTALSLSPGAYWNSGQGFETRTYRLDANADFQLSKWLWFRCYYGFSRQDGRVVVSEGAPILEQRPVTRNVVTAAIFLGRPFRIDRRSSAK